MSNYANLFFIFGVYLMFMLAFFIVLCLVCLVVLFWYQRRYTPELTSSTEPREDTPMRRQGNDF